MNDYSYLIRRKVFKLFGAAFHIYDPAGNLIGFSQQKAFKLKEDIRVYTDETKRQELIVILARNIIDFSAAYDVFESSTNTYLGTWQRRGFSSLIRDQWQLFDGSGMQTGEILEDSAGMALVRRFVANWIPQDYFVMHNGNIVATMGQNFNPFVFKLKVCISPQNTLHPYLILAGGILLAAIEGRQN
ncbi:MAG: hypothetical protein II943_08375 [Victivallales bacterium]|nr:hypothetical protein [Victivallales bacterium]